MNTNCNDVDIYEDIRHCAGEVNIPGTLPYFFMLKKANIRTWPTLAKRTDPGATIAKLAVYKGSFGIGSDYQWVRVDMVPDSATFKSENQGSWGSKTFNNQATLVVPGTKEAVTGMVTEINNDSCVIVIPDRNGKLRVIGSEEFDVMAEIKQEQGKSAASDSVLTTIELSCTSTASLPFYEGMIVTSDGVVYPDGLFYRYTLLYKVGNEVVRTESDIVEVSDGHVTVSAETFKNSEGTRKFSAQRTSVVITRDEQEVTIPTTEIQKDYAYVKAMYQGNVIKTFNSKEKGFPNEVYNDYVYFNRVIEVNGVYYSVPGSFENTRNYAVLIDCFGENWGKSVSYARDQTGIVYYAESEDMALSGSFRGEELVPERASGGEWHRLSANSGVSTARIDTSEGPYKLTVAARNMGSTVGVLTIRMGSTTIGTLEWDAAAYSEKSIEIPADLALTGAVDIYNETGFTSGVCIDYVMIRKLS